jgi:hypothetical protein
VTNFADVYYGPSATNPTLRNDGTALQSGDLYFNTASAAMRVYGGVTWTDVGTALPITINQQSFNGTGSQTVFTLSSAPTSTATLEVFIGGVRQVPTTVYSASGTTLTFTAAPPAGTANIFARWVSPIAVGVPSDDTVSTSKIQDGAVATEKIADAAVTPSKLSQKLTQGTAVASTSGTAIDFTSIPAWVKRITVMLNGLSTNGTSQYLVQLGSSGGVEATGYVATVMSMQSNTSYTAAGASNGIVLMASAYSSAATSWLGAITFVNLAGNVWVASGVLSREGGTGSSLAGSKTLSGVLDRVRITTSNGTDTFDAGSINILYEG